MFQHISHIRKQDKIKFSMKVKSKRLEDMHILSEINDEKKSQVKLSRGFNSSTEAWHTVLVTCVIKNISLYVSIRLFEK